MIGRPKNDRKVTKEKSADKQWCHCVHKAAEKSAHRTIFSFYIQYIQTIEILDVYSYVVAIYRNASCSINKKSPRTCSLFYQRCLFKHQRNEI